MNHDLQHHICRAVVERFGERMPAEAGETLYQVMMLVLLGPDSVHTGRRPAPTTNSFNLFPGELEGDDNLVSSQGDDPAAARGEGGDRDEIASGSSESAIEVAGELIDGMVDMLSKHTDLIAALAPQFLKEAVAQFATHGSELRRIRWG